MRKKILLAAALAAAGCKQLGIDKQEKKGAPSRTEKARQADAATSQTKVSGFKFLQQIAQDASPHSVDDLIKALVSRGLVQNHVLMHTSESRERADVSAETPRVILLLKGAALGAFTTNASGSFFQRAQFIEFDPQSASYAFAEMIFDAKAGATLVSDGTACKACHGKNPRPNWEEGPTWPNAFGGGDGVSFPQSDSERPGYQHFRDGAASLARYAALPPVRFEQKNNANPGELSAIVDLTLEISSEGDQRHARLIEATTNFAQNAPGFFQTILNCDGKHASEKKEYGKAVIDILKPDTTEWRTGKLPQADANEFAALSAGNAVFPLFRNYLAVSPAVLRATGEASADAGAAKLNALLFEDAQNAFSAETITSICSSLAGS